MSYSVLKSKLVVRVNEKVNGHYQQSFSKERVDGLSDSNKPTLTLMKACCLGILVFITLFECRTKKEHDSILEIEKKNIQKKTVKRQIKGGLDIKLKNWEERHLLIEKHTCQTSKNLFVQNLKSCEKKKP